MSIWILMLLAQAQQQTLAAQRASLQQAGFDPSVVVIEYRGASPELWMPGSVQFAWSGLGKPAISNSDAVLFWRGELTTVTGERKSVWSRVRLKIKRNGFRTTRSINVRTVIGNRDVEAAEWEASIFQPAALASADDIVGKKASRSILRGKPVLDGLVTAQAWIEAGGPISVEVQQGLARLQFDSIAENTARPGERVFFRSPLNGRRISGFAADGRTVRMTRQ